MKMWAGRFKKEEDSQVNDFNSSIRFDKRLYKQDITGSIAHAEMLAKTGIISRDESEKIIEGLKNILAELESGKLEVNMNAEDIHMFVEEVLTERIGNAGKRLHTSRSRNDQVALDMKMYVKCELDEVMSRVATLAKTVIETAKQHTDSVMPGYTHLQRAQPVTLAHQLLAYAQMLRRDYKRLENCKELADECPLGACALATTTYPIDRHMTAEALGFSAVTENSIDSVSDRDYVLEFAFCLSVIMMHMSRFSEEIILWCSSEFSYLELDDAFATGSSIMPQKKNPDIAELVRGKTGRVYGALIGLLTVMKGIPLAYNKDMQEDKEQLFDAIDNTKLCLEVFTRMLATCTFKKEALKNGAKKGFINATDCADYLVKKGVPFREAYKITGGLVARCIELDTSFEELPIAEYKAASEIFAEDVYEFVKIDNCVNERKVYGGPGAEAVMVQIKNLESFFDEEEN